MSVIAAKQIDTKVDDGLPQSGRITAAMAMHNYGFWAGAGVWPSGAAPSTAATPSINTCYDNGNNAAILMQYSTGFEDGKNFSCALSFEMP